MKRRGAGEGIRQLPAIARKAVFYLIMAICLFTGLVTGVRECYLVVFTQAFLLLFAWGMNLWTALTFAYTQTTDREEAVKGDRVTLNLGIYNDMPYPFPMMRVHITAVARGQDAEEAFSLAPFEKILLEEHFTCAYRGEYRIGISYLEIQDVFGLCRLRFHMLRRPYYRQKPLLIYPRADAMGILPSRSHDAKFYNGLRLLAADSGENLAGVREYREGDAQKRIHWKISAMHQALYSREFEQPMESRCLLFLDGRTGAQGEEALRREDLLCECAATLLYQCLRLNRAVAVCGSNGRIAEGVSTADFSRLRRFLALLPFEDKSAADTIRGQLIRSRERHPVYILAASAHADLLQAASDAAKAAGSNIIFVTLAGAGDAFPADPFPQLAIASAEEIPFVLGESFHG